MGKWTFTVIIRKREPTSVSMFVTMKTEGATQIIMWQTWSRIDHQLLGWISRWRVSSCGQFSKLTAYLSCACETYQCFFSFSTITPMLLGFYSVTVVMGSETGRRSPLSTALYYTGYPPLSLPVFSHLVTADELHLPFEHFIGLDQYVRIDHHRSAWLSVSH